MEIKKEDEFSSLYIYAMLLKHKYWIISITILSTLISGFIAFTYLENEYKSTINVVPPQNTGNAMDNAIGSISGALKDIGLTKLGGSGGESYSFIVVLTSRTVMDSIINEFDLPKVYDIPAKEMSLVRQKFEENLEVNYERDGNYFISVWDKDKDRAANMANRYVEIANSLAIKIYREEVAINKRNMEERMNSTDSVIKAITDTLQKFSRRTQMFYPTEQASALSKSLAEMKSEEIKYDMVYDYYVNLYGKDDYTTQSVLGMKEKMAQKISEAMTKPGFAGNFTLDNAAKEGIEFMRLYAELETYSKVKAFMMPMIEKNKLDETKKMKNLIVLDKAIPADRKDRPKRSLIVAGSAFGTFALTIFIILIINSLKSFNRKLKQFSE
jgi:capsular polysaccharide biosynthesis protein